MEQPVAAAVVRATREQAEDHARDDLTALRRRAVEAGRQRSRDVVKVTTINRETGQIRQNLAGRVLRDWYLHVYVNTLRARLGQPSEPIDAQQVEDTARLLRRLKPNAEPLRALKAVGVARNVAVADAASTAVKITEQLREVGEVRAIRHAPEERFDGDELRVHVARHWFKRCYDNVIDEAVAVRHPLAGVTAAEEHQVARILATREARRLIGRDGIPLVTEFGTRLTALDKRLAVEGVTPVSREKMLLPDSDDLRPVSERVAQTWDILQRDARDKWLRAAGATPIEYDLPWARLGRNQQAQLFRHYITTQLRQFRSAEFGGRALVGDSAEVARAVFGHAQHLGTTDARSDARGLEHASPRSEQLDRASDRDVPTRHIG